MSWFPCPVCDQSNAPHSNRCSACAADFSDPDVMAMMGHDKSDLPALDVAAGSLDHGKFLGISKTGLEEGGAVRKLAIFGACMLAAAFLIPVAPNFGDAMPAWKAMEHAPSIALLFPALAALMGLTAAFGPLESWQRSATLMLAGVLGLGTLPFLGPLSGSPSKFMPVLILGCVVSAWGLLLRSFDSQSNIARRILVGGALLSVVGFLIPMSDAQNAVPLELQFFLREEIGNAMPLSAFWTVLNRDPMVFFSCVYLLIPLVLYPLGAVVSWSKPKEAWDKRSGVIRLIAWTAVLYAPVGFALFTFNLMGYEGSMVVIDQHVIPWDDFQGAALTGRFRLTLLSAAFAAWAILPIVGVAGHFAARGEEPESKSPPIPSDS